MYTNKLIILLITTLVVFNVTSVYLLFNGYGASQPGAGSVRPSDGINQVSPQAPGQPSEQVIDSQKIPAVLTSSKSRPVTEICDGIDNNDDGQIDEGIDRDLDGKSDGPCTDADYPGGKEAYFKFLNSIKR